MTKLHFISTKKLDKRIYSEVPFSRYLRHIIAKGVLLYSYPDTLSLTTIAQV